MAKNVLIFVTALSGTQLLGYYSITGETHTHTHTHTHTQTTYQTSLFTRRSETILPFLFILARPVEIQKFVN